MRKTIWFVSTVLLAANAHAQFNILSDNQNVSVSGWATDPSGNVSQNYSQSQTQSYPFANFSSNLSGSASGPFGNNTLFTGSSASQTTSLGSGLLSYSGTVSAVQSYPAPPGHLYADAFSTFSVSFSVDSATAFTLSDNQHNWDPSGAREALTLSSSTGGTIFGGPLFGSGMEEYSGTLDPDQIYTLQISLSTQDYVNPSAAQAFDVTLSSATPTLQPVPEPAPSLLLGSGAIMVGILAWRKRRTFAAR